jgi:integrase
MALQLHRFHPRFGVMWSIGSKTGLRIGDLLKLRCRDVCEAMQIQEQKTGTRRTVDITPDVMLEIARFSRLYHLRPDDYLFYRREYQRDQPMTRQWAHRVISRTANEIGLNFIGAHSMRKIYACNLYLASGSFKCVQEALHHKHPSTTMSYLRDLLPGAIA